MRKLLFLPVFLFLLSLQGQRIEPRAALAVEVGGTEIVEMTDTAEVCALMRFDNYLETNLTLFVDEAAFVDGVVPAGSTLYNDELDACAKTLVDIKTVGDSIIDKRMYRSHRLIHIRGLVHKNRFLEGSIPELTYEDILKTKSRAVQEEMLEQMFDEQDFEREEEGDLSFWVKRKTGCSLKYEEGEAPFRFIIVLRGGRPFCVVTDGASFNAAKLKDEKEEGSYRFYYFQKARADIHERIRTMMYSYIPL